MGLFFKKKKAKRQVNIYFLGYMTENSKPRNRIVETLYPIEEVSHIKYLQSKLLDIDKLEGLAAEDEKEPTILAITLLSVKEV